MNSIIQSYYPVFQMYQSLRNQMMDVLTDEDLGFQIGQQNPTFGALCKEMGEVEYAYIQSFKTFKGDFSYLLDDPEMENNVSKLTAWYQSLDIELKAAIAELTEEDLKNRAIDRGGDFHLPPQIQLDVYKEALLIFYGKASVYLKALDKPMPQQWQEWIG
jgi:hypothetical protein